MSQLKYRLIVLLGVLGVSMSAICVKYATAPSPVLALYRNGFAVLLMIPLVLKNNRDELKALDPRTFLFSVISGIFLALHFTCYFESLRFTSVASSTLLVDTEVFFVALVSILFWREKIPKAGWIGIAMTFAGSVLLAVSDAGGGADILKGDVLALSGAVFVTVYTLIGRNARKNVSNTVYTFIVYSATSITLMIIAAISRIPLTGYGHMNYFWGLMMTVFCTFLGHTIFNWGLKYVPAAFVSTAKLGEPVFSTILAVFLFSQVPDLLKILGGVIILGGLYTYTTAAKEE